MKKIKMKEVLKSKNALLIAMVVILFILFLVVILKSKNGPDVMVSEGTNNSLLEPVSKDEKVVADKLEAYKKDQIAAKKEKMLEEDRVKGSDFYFDMQESDNKYRQRMKRQIERMQTDPYEHAMGEYGGSRSDFEGRMRENLNRIENDQEIEDLEREHRAYEESKKKLEYRMGIYDNVLGKYFPDKKDSVTTSPKVEDDDVAEDVAPEPRFIVNEKGKRKRRPQYVVPGKKNLVKAAIYGDQTVVSGTPVKMRLLEPLLISGVEIPANTFFSGTASVAASRLKITVENFRYGTYISPVSFVIFDNDAIEGLNLPNNMKAESARKMEQGLLQGVQLPISSIGTVTSEVTSAITATTQVAKQLLNQSLSQVKVHLKANYQIFLKEETKQDKRKREAEEAELERMFKQIEMQKNEPTKKDPLTSLIESL